MQQLRGRRVITLMSLALVLALALGIGVFASGQTGGLGLLGTGAAETNVALGKHATQSSLLANPCNPHAGKAVDGNANGTFHPVCSTTHTNADAQAWWKVDLLGRFTINRIVIYNRFDCCQNRLSDFDVAVSLNGTNWTTVWSQSGAAGTTTSLAPINQTARYVKVQLRGTGYLSLAEVQVFGTQVPGTPNLVLNHIADVTVVASGDDDVQCPGDYRRDDQDLNEGAGGDYIYLCLKPGAAEEGMLSLMTLDLTNAPDSWVKDSTCGGSYKIIPIDLNKGAGGWDIYFCKLLGPPQAGGKPIKNISFHTYHGLSTDRSGACHSWGDGWTEARAISVRGGVSYNGDLNIEAGGRYIYACIQR